MNKQNMKGGTKMEKGLLEGKKSSYMAFRGAILDDVKFWCRGFLKWW